MIITTNPQAAYLAHRKEIDQAIATVLDSGWYILGQQVSAFEAEFARYLGAGFAVTTASGTDGIELALRACGIGEGDVVITVSHTAVATVAAIERCGALPVLIDIDPDTYTMDPQRLEHAIQSVEGTARAIIPVHLYGHPADMAAINDIAQLHDLLVIEDCAQAHGATIGGQKVGTFGDMAAFSFYPTKNLGALGDGGCVVTSNESLCHKARALREYGWQDRYISAEPGINSRLDELQAAVLRVKLRYLDQNNARRGEIAQIYHDQLIATDLVLPRVQPDCTHVYHQFVVQSEQRDDLRQFLRDYDIGSLVHYPAAIHQQPAYRDRLPDAGNLRCTERVVRHILSLPIYPELTDEQVITIAQCLGKWNSPSSISQTAFHKTG